MRKKTHQNNKKIPNHNAFANFVLKTNKQKLYSVLILSWKVLDLSLIDPAQFPTLPLSSWVTEL